MRKEWDAGLETDNYAGCKPSLGSQGLGIQSLDAPVGLDLNHLQKSINSIYIPLFNKKCSFPRIALGLGLHSETN